MDPLLAQVSPNEERKSSNSLPLSLQARLPQRVWWELVSEPIIRGRLLSLANLASGDVSLGGAGPFMSMYDDARIRSVVFSLILTATWSGVVNCLISQLLLVRLLWRTIAARRLLSPFL